MTRPKSKKRPGDTVTFELLRGVRSVGTVTWEEGGWLRLRVRDESQGRPLIEHFGGPVGPDPVGDVRFRREELGPMEFERLCVALRARPGYAVVPRPARPG